MKEQRSSCTRIAEHTKQLRMFAAKRKILKTEHRALKREVRSENSETGGQIKMQDLAMRKSKSENAPELHAEI